MKNNASSHQRLSSERNVNPFIAIPPPFRRRTADSAAVVPATAAMTTVIDMDNVESDERESAVQREVNDTDIRTTPEVVGTGVADGGSHVLLREKKMETVKASELASAALRHLPTHTASEVGAIRADPSEPLAHRQASSPRVCVDHLPADTQGASPRTSTIKSVCAAATTARSPSLNRFMVPKSLPSPSAVLSATHLSHSPPPQRKEKISYSPEVYPRANVEGGRDDVELLDTREGEEEEEEDEEEEGDQVAARALQSLHQKDDMIAQLMRTVSALQIENTALRSCPAASGEIQKAPPSPTTGLATSPERTKTSSPSWPATPVRWWSTNRDAAPTDVSQRQSVAFSNFEVSARADVNQRRTLEDRKGDWEMCPRGDAAPRENSSTPSITEPTTAPPLRNSTTDSFTPGAEAAPSASRVTEISMAQTRIAQLEWQLENIQQEKREDTHVLRDHIGHLTRELHRKKREMVRQQRQHKLELTALQREAISLSNQLDNQARSSERVAAAAPRREAEGNEVLELRSQLAQAKARELQILSESAALRQRWREELEEQKNLIDEARISAVQDEGRRSLRREEERQLAQVAAQQHHLLEGQVSQYKAALSQAQRELSELRTAHQRTEETVSEQRNQMQCIGHDLATALLERAHHEQRAGLLGSQVKTLHQQLRQAESILSTKQTELETLQRERQSEATVAVALQEEEHATLLRHVEGCMKSSEDVESALLESERARHELVLERERALAERDKYHQLYRETSVQSQAQLLEQEQLLIDRNDVVCKQLHEAQKELVRRTDTLETTQRELEATQQQMHTLRDELARSEAAQRKLEEEIQAAQKRFELQTEQLVQTKESLKNALQAQLATMNKLKKKEELLRSQHAIAQRAMERRQEEQRVLQKTAELLWPREVNHMFSIPSPYILRSAAKPTPQSMPRRVTVRLQRDVDCNAKKTRCINAHPSGHKTGDSAPRVVVDLDSPLRHAQSASSSISSLTASVAMSAVSPSDAPTASSADCDAAMGERHRCSPVDWGEKNTSDNTEGTAFIASPLDTHLDGGLCVLEQHQHQRFSDIAHTHEEQNAAIGDELPFLRLLRTVHDAVGQRCAAHDSVQRALATRSAAVRVLVKERKAQQQRMKELRAQLQRQQHAAERLRRDAVQCARAASQAELRKVDEVWRKKCEAGVALQLRSYERQHRHAVAQLVYSCAKHLQADLINFVQHLPLTLSLGLAEAASSRKDVFGELMTRDVCAPHTRCTAYHNTEAQGPQLAAVAVAAADSTSLVSSGLEVVPEVEAECDTIIRTILGVAGGWADLKSAVLSSSSAAAAGDLSCSAPHLAASQPCAVAHGSAAEHTCTPLAADWSPNIVVNAETARWSAEEIADLEEVIHEYLIHTLSALTTTPPLSSSAGADTHPSGSGVSEVQRNVDDHTLGTPRALSAASGVAPSASFIGTTTQSTLEAASMVTALPHWMRPLGASLRHASSSSFSAGRESLNKGEPRRGVTVDKAATSALPPHHHQPCSLTLLLDACVAHVHAQLLT